MAAQSCILPGEIDIGTMTWDNNVDYHIMIDFTQYKTSILLLLLLIEESTKTVLQKNK